MTFKLDFSPTVHGWHFANNFVNHEKEAPTKQVRGIWQGDLDHASVDTTVDVT